MVVGGGGGGGGGDNCTKWIIVLWLLIIKLNEEGADFKDLSTLVICLLSSSVLQIDNFSASFAVSITGESGSHVSIYNLYTKSDWFICLYQHSSYRMKDSKTPVTLGRRSHGDLDRHQIAVGPPWHRHETPWNRLERRGTAFVFCCKLQTPSFEKRRGTQCNRRDNAVQSPTTSWQRSESVVRSPWERQGGRQRLHSVYAAFMAIARRLPFGSFSPQMNSRFFWSI
jgi:hypothetical protein